MFLSERVSRNNDGINRYQSASVRDWLPDYEAGTNVAVFGGNGMQRKLVVEQGIVRCLGRIGIVVIHNNLLLENDLSNFRNCFPEVGAAYANTPICIVNNHNLCYEPLYGMTYNRAIETIYPEVSKDSSMYMQQHLCSAALKAYTSILQYKNIPIDLDNLLYLCNLDLNELEQKELADLPSEQAGDVLAVLMQENIVRQVKADVNYFAAQLDERIWDKSREPSNVSIMEAVRNKALISVKASSNNMAVLDYLAAELSCLLECNAPCLLVVDSVLLRHSRLKDILMNPSVSLLTIIAGNSIQELFDEAQEEGTSAVHKADKIILFQCANVTVAKQYSGMIGEYMRQFVSISDNRHRGAFDFFASHGQGKSVSEQLYARLTPEELVRLGEGAVLIDQRNGSVELVKRLYEA